MRKISIIFLSVVIVISLTVGALAYLILKTDLFQNNNVTRGEFLKHVLEITYGDINFESFEKAFDHELGRYVNFAKRSGAIDNVEITFENIDKPITRIEVAKIIANIENKNKPVGSFLVGDKILEEYELKYQLKFTDIDELSENDKKLLTRICSEGYMIEDGKDTFKPNKSLTPAEVDNILNLYSQNINNSEV